MPEFTSIKDLQSSLRRGAGMARNIADASVSSMLSAADLLEAADKKITELVLEIGRLRRPPRDNELPEANRASQESGS